MNAGASLGFSAMVYQSAAISFARCEAAGGISIRLDANAPKCLASPEFFFSRLGETVEF